jgi:hypothetical protein
VFSSSKTFLVSAKVMELEMEKSADETSLEHNEYVQRLIENVLIRAPGVKTPSKRHPSMG